MILINDRIVRINATAVCKNASVVRTNATVERRKNADEGCFLQRGSGLSTRVRQLSDRGEIVSRKLFNVSSI